jgi:hypothetical protein
VTFFDLFVFCISNQLFFKPPNKAVILSEALPKSIANRRLYGAESKDPEGLVLTMPRGAFQPPQPAPGGVEDDYSA